MDKNSPAFSFRQDSYPPDLEKEGEEILAQLISAKDLPFVDTAFLKQARRVLPLSRFLTAAVKKDPGMFIKAAGFSALAGPCSRQELSRKAAGAVKDVGDEEGLLSALRGFRNRQIFEIAWKDMTGLAGIEETLAELSSLADICIDLSIKRLYQDMAGDFGMPVYPDGRPQGMIVLAMGKLGAEELNFSSDIDLIFAYPLRGSTKGAARSISNEEFFTRLARKLIRVLSLSTENGIVFRVDTRLRPFGDSGPLVLCADAVEEYYENYGRQWERYAMVKARAAAGDLEAGCRLLDALKPFVYKRYLDYSTIESLRQMKAMILAEQDREGLKRDIKLGPGGIRDIEFICQTFQLLKGGRIPVLQERHLLKVLEHLENLSLLDSETCRQLREAYIFLRVVENRLQEYSDQQVHCLPSDPDRLLRLAVSMGFASRDDFRSRLEGHMERAHTIFDGLFAEKRQQAAATDSEAAGSKAAAGHAMDSAPAENGRKQCLLIWEAPDDPSSKRRLSSLGFSGAASRLAALRGSKKIKLLPGRTREILDELMPQLIAACSSTSNPDKALEGSLKIIEAVLRRSIYLMLLLEYPQALFHLVTLCAKSRWLTDLLSRQPILLDELIDAANLFRPLSEEELKSQISAVTASISGNDLELFLDELRRFRKSSMLRVAACDLDNLISVEQSGQMLTCLAQTLIDRCLDNALGYMNRREPSFYQELPPAERSGMAVIAYGKMGGREMGYSSDLDLVFLYDPASLRSGDTEDTGKTAYFFSRLVQRLIFLLTTRTSQGVLYQIDTRLRPNGSQGALVSSLESFAEYQKKRAWTWEHQAMVRARFITGDKKTGLAFEKIRKEVLMTKRKGRALPEDVFSMRKKIVKNIKRAGSSPFFDLKRDPGGIVDIEFLVQYLVLYHAAGHEQLTAATGCLELLKILSSLQLLSSRETDVLTQAYRLYMKTVNHLTLDLQDPRVPAGRFEDTRALVTEIFNRILNT